VCEWPRERESEREPHVAIHLCACFPRLHLCVRLCPLFLHLCLWPHRICVPVGQNSRLSQLSFRFRSRFPLQFRAKHAGRRLVLLLFATPSVFSFRSRRLLVFVVVRCLCLMASNWIMFEARDYEQTLTLCVYVCVLA